MSATRPLDGIDLPAPGVWEIDPGHADIAFIGRHLMLTKVRGRFAGVAGAITVADDPSESRVDVTIDMASVDSGDARRDQHLRGPDLFDVEHHPTATFRSATVTPAGAGGTVSGDLTLRGVTRPVTLQVTYLGHARDPWGNDRVGFRAHATINREHWDLTWNMVLDTGGLVVSKDIRVEIELEAVRQR